MRYALLNPNLEELAKEGRIKITVGKAKGFDITNRAIGLQRRRLILLTLFPASPGTSLLPWIIPQDNMSETV
jgi:hypothetical protein